MRLEATEKARKGLTVEQCDSFDSILGLVNDLAASGHLVVKDNSKPQEDKRNPAGRWVGDKVDSGQDAEQTEYIDNEGRDRALRIGEPAPNERQDAPPTAGNQPPFSAGDTRTADRLDRMESLVGELLAAVQGNLFPEVGKGFSTDRPLGSRVPWGRDDDQDRRTERPYDKRGLPTDQSFDPHTLSLQGKVYEDPAEKTVTRSEPVGVSPADARREMLLHEVLKEVRPRGDFGATNGAPMDSQAMHEAVKGTLAALFGDRI